ncbi:hypothetical protein [Marinicella sp. W31]|uniref:hypothetical protein n=1 Tax=Marinicella sp. W31 TaxID=3023713 RepID=UPI00375717DF
MSFDSAFQYWQVRTGEWSSLHPVIMQLHWWLTDHVISGPGGLFMFYVVVFFLATYIIAIHSRLKLWAQITLILVMGFLPYNLMVMPHVWKDVGMLVYTLLGVALLIRFLDTKALSSLFFAAGCLWLAVLFRVNALLILFPLLVYVCFLLARRFENKRLVLILLPVYLLIIFLSHVGLKKISDTHQEILWPSLALWDIASVSQRIDAVLLPEFTTGPGGDWLNEIKEHNKSWSNTPVLHNSGEYGIWHGLGTSFSAEQYEELAQVWLSLLWKYPLAYADHRVDVMFALMGLTSKQGYPFELMFVDREVQYKDNPVFQPSQNMLAVGWFEFLKQNMNFWFVNGWFYGILFIAAVIGYRRRYQPPADQKYKSMMGVLLVTAVLGVLSLVVTVPAAESRYLIVFVNFTMLSLLLMYLPRDIKKQESSRQIMQ